MFRLMEKLLTGDPVLKGIVNLHVFTEAADVEQARAAGDILLQKLEAYEEIELCRLKRYWKIPEYYEFSIEIGSPIISKNTPQEISKILGGRWKKAGDSLILYQTKGKPFPMPNIKWASLEYIDL
ncbi:hypothetical protein NFG57_10030 [Halomonas sp. H10-59]|uniref:Uncharacterized protein n=2 Tax=unclassified Halomonas TaxID=2609666 RepID=A0AAU7KZX2_9GAMM|nr:hypothetical protein [Halomonas sp. MMSF_3323]